MSRTTSWWHDLPSPTKFRLYTKLTMQAAVVVAVIAVAIPLGDPSASIGFVVAGLAAVVALEMQPELSTWPSPPQRRWALVVSALVLVGVWVTGAIAVRGADSDAAADTSRALGLYAAMLGTLALVSFTRHRWWMIAAISIAAPIAFGASRDAALRVFATTLGLELFVVTTTLLALWSLKLVVDLERAKGLGAELQLAEERLRFARDLHDVVGRSFSTIAVKSELAATLSRSGDADRATAEMDEVKALAVQSMAEMRQIVRGYRDIDLAGEVAGARSLLSATGCHLTVEGDPSAVPARCHEIAAWAVREGTTNIVKHSSATTATLALGPTGMSLRNDGSPGEPGERTGLLGLSERLATRGATLTVLTDGDEFALEIRWSTS